MPHPLFFGRTPLDSPKPSSYTPTRDSHHPEKQTMKTVIVPMNPCLQWDIGTGKMILF